MRLDLFPLNTVLLPSAKMPLHIFEDRYLELIKDCVSRSKPLGIVLIKAGSAEEGLDIDIYDIGTIADVIECDANMDGTMDIVVQGRQRFQVVELVKRLPRVIADVELVEWGDRVMNGDVLRELQTAFESYLQVVLAVAGQWQRQFRLPERPSDLTSLIFKLLQVTVEERQKLLECAGIEELICLELKILRRDLPRLETRLGAMSRRSLN
tara:strand:- start:460 stop:1089 length:630 start_codon:yes stop_codon:yes gene_type:complete